MTLDINALITAKILNNGGGGGGSGITKIAEKEFAVSTTSTSAVEVGYVPIDEQYWTGDKIFLVTAVDKAGKRAGYDYGAVTLFVNQIAKNNATGTFTTVGIYYTGVKASAIYTSSAGNSGYGVYAAQWGKDDGILIKSRYSSSYGAIDGTFKVTVYQLDIPFLA